MKIHYTAQSWHGGFYRFIQEALREAGHEVVFFDEAGSRGQALAQKIAGRIPRYSYRLAKSAREKIGESWLRSVEAADPDWVFLEYAPNILPLAVRKAKERGRKIAYWLTSPPAGCAAKDVLAALEHADRVFTIDRKWMTILYPESRTIFLPLAGDPHVFEPLALAPKHDVAFIGSFPPESADGYLRAKFAAELSKKYAVRISGTGLDYWRSYYPELKDLALSTERLDAAALNRIYNESKIVLTLHSTWHTSSLSARVFEIALSGAFQLIDWREDLDRLLPPGSYASFRSLPELEEMVSLWLPRAEERRESADRLRAEVLAKHTWKTRVAELLAALESRP